MSSAGYLGSVVDSSTSVTSHNGSDKSRDRRPVSCSSVNSPQHSIEFFQSNVNLPAILNDPHKLRPSDFLTRTWGDNFVEQPVHSSPLLADFALNDFRPYIRTVNLREALSKGIRSPGERRKKLIANSAQAATTIPSVFFTAHFTLKVRDA